jgi:hypothetical protein
MGYDDGMNAYTYCRNNPLSWTDPYGLCKGSLSRKERIKIAVFSAVAEGAGWLHWGIHTGLDIAGCIDPTPICDTLNAAGYAGEGDWTNVVISAGAVIPYVGDVGKAGKYTATGLKAADRIADARRIWSKGRAASRVKNAFKHWAKHRGDFADVKNAKQYVEKARRFLDDPPKGVLRKIRANGDKLLYDPKTNTLVVEAVDGTPKTMFKPKDGINYFNKQ